jgi:hypothetical protein
VTGALGGDRTDADQVAEVVERVADRVQVAEQHGVLDQVVAGERGGAAADLVDQAESEVLSGSVDGREGGAELVAAGDERVEDRGQGVAQAGAGDQESA